MWLSARILNIPYTAKRKQFFSNQTCKIMKQHLTDQLGSIALHDRPQSQCLVFASPNKSQSNVKTLASFMLLNEAPEVRENIFGIFAQHICCLLEDKLKLGEKQKTNKQKHMVQYKQSCTPILICLQSSPLIKISKGQGNPAIITDNCYKRVARKKSLHEFICCKQVICCKLLQLIRRNEAMLSQLCLLHEMLARTFFRSIYGCFT